jgi:predicted RNase H-like nuclease (RuvC/YqgF family)
MTLASAPLPPLFAPWILIGYGLLMTTSAFAQIPVAVPHPNLVGAIVQNQQQQQQAAVANQIVQNQQLQQLQNQQAVTNQIVANHERQQQVLAVGNEFGAYPHLGHLVNELDQNEKSLAALEYDQSSLQAKIAKSKAELARHNSIVETLEERQRFEIGALQGKIKGMKRYIANLEVSKEELRQKLLAANQKAIYGDSQLVAKAEELRGKNQLLKNQRPPCG